MLMIYARSKNSTFNAFSALLTDIVTICMRVRVKTLSCSALRLIIGSRQVGFFSFVPN